MTPPRPTIALRRAELGRALKLSATDLRVLVLLLMKACPSSGRTWEPSERLAEALHLSDAVVRTALEKLERGGFLEIYPGVMQGLPCIELGRVLVRAADPPENLPVEPKRAV